MKCTEIQQRIGPYLDGELPEEIRRRIERHLDGCDRCGDLSARRRRLRCLLDVLPHQKAREDFARRVREEAEKRLGAAEPVIVPFSRRTALLARVAAVVALVAGVALGGFMGATASAATRPADQDVTADLLSPVPPESVSATYLDWIEEEE